MIDKNLFVMQHILTIQDNAQYRKVFFTMLSWSKSILGLLNKHPEFISFVITLSDVERSSMQDIIKLWPDSLLVRFKNNKQHLVDIHRMWDIVPDHAAFVKTYFTIVDHKSSEHVVISDAFSCGQINSKLWLVDTVIDLGLHLNNVWTLCGWIGTLGYLMLLKKQELGIFYVRSFDIDDNCRPLAEILNKPYVKSNWEFKAATLDVNTLYYTNFKYDLLRHAGDSCEVTETPDTVINTSCDHMGNDDKWFTNIPTGKLVILQNNNWVDNDQHNNCINSIDEFKRMYPLTTVLYADSRVYQKYTRFMMIGYK
jgi:hypothetical protein